MAASTKAESGSKASPRKQKYDAGSYPASPLGATPRTSLPQRYNLPFSSYRLTRDEISQEWKSATEHTKSILSSPIKKSHLKWPFDHVDSSEASKEAAEEESTTKSFILLAVIFLSSLVALLMVYFNFPKMQEDEIRHIKLPRDIEDAKNLGRVLDKYTDRHFYSVFFGYFVTYIFLQSFAIPGSIFLSILSGYLFPYYLSLFTVCMCSGIGASFCYLLSYLVGRQLVQKYIPERVAEWKSHVIRHREHLLNYIIFLRITPFLPNWFINITSPVIGVPLLPFFIGTFIGVAPPSVVAIQAGTTLHQLTSSKDALSWTSVIVLAVLALLSLLPVVFKKKLREKFD